MKKTETNDILVAGTGPTGSIAALALAKAGFGVTLVGPPVRRDDRRTTALMSPALKFLDTLGIVDAVETHSAPLRIMRIIDGTGRLIRSPVVTFRATEIGEDAFGLNIPNQAMNDALEAALSADERIDWRKTLVEHWEIDDEIAAARLDDGSRVSARLAVAADGRTSAARDAAGIKATRHAYNQAALVLTFVHSRDHAFTSTEFHTETGPFTQVPLPGNRSSLVWVVGPRYADELAARDDAALSVLVEQRMQSMLGKVTVEPGRQIYQLSAILPRSFAQNRVALIGEAAHVFPPIGAQGLNLGIRDIQDLVGIVERYADDPGAETATRDYNAKRRPDVMARTGAVNLLNLSLLSDLLPAQIARSAGLGFLESFSPVRAFFMREGMQPGSGVARMVSSLREQIRR